MGEKKENTKLQSTPVHPAVLKVSGDESRRWCAAIWSTDPDERQLVGKIQRLVESTLVAHWMQPPTQYEPQGQVVNSFDLIFYDSVPESLKQALKDSGFQAVHRPLLAPEEYEQFQAFEEEAIKAGRGEVGNPVAVWRVSIERPEGLQSPSKLGGSVAEKLGDQFWGQAPGWISRVFCEELKEITDVEVSPDRAGLERLERTLFGGPTGGIRWMEPMAYQAVCDFIGVVLQATTSLDVQWGTSPVDEKTGLAPAPVLRVRQSGGDWAMLAVGNDIIRRACVPWGEDVKTERVLLELLADYDERAR